MFMVAVQGCLAAWLTRTKIYPLPPAACREPKLVSRIAYSLDHLESTTLTDRLAASRSYI